MKKFCCISLIILLLGIWSICTMAEVNETESNTWQNVFFLKNAGRDMARLLYGIGLEDSSVPLSLASVKAASPETDGWEKAMFLAEDSRDMKRLTNYEMIHWENYRYPDIMSFLESLDAQPNMSKIYISITSGEMDEMVQEYKEIGKVNFDNYEKTVEGIPIGYVGRHIMVPAYSQENIAGLIDVFDYSPDDDEPIYIPDSGGVEFMWIDPEMGLVTTNQEPESWSNAKEGYAVLREKGIVPINIVELSDYSTDLLNKCVFITEENQCYIYPIAIKGEEEKGYQALSLEECIIALANESIIEGPIPQPTPTPEPTPVPILPYTPKYTPRPTVVTPTATPSAGGTTTPALTATASLFPASSSAPEQSADSTVLIVIGAVLVIAAAGAAGWAVFRKKKGKE